MHEHHSHPPLGVVRLVLAQETTDRVVVRMPPPEAKRVACRVGVDLVPSGGGQIVGHFQQTRARARWRRRGLLPDRRCANRDGPAAGFHPAIQAGRGRARVALRSPIDRRRRKRCAIPRPRGRGHSAFPPRTRSPRPDSQRRTRPLVARSPFRFQLFRLRRRTSSRRRTYRPDRVPSVQAMLQPPQDEFPRYFAVRGASVSGAGVAGRRERCVVRRTRSSSTIGRFGSWKSRRSSTRS